MSWEDVFSTWAQGPSATEEQKCSNAESQVKKAIASNATLAGRAVTTFAQGSYRARANVRQESDVDICLRGNLPFFVGYPLGKGHQDFGNYDLSTPPVPQFREMILVAVV